MFATTTLEGLEPGAFDWVAYLYWGTVLEPGEDVSSERVLAAAGPGGALAYHATYELYGRDAVPDIPGGKEWLSVIDERPEDERHLDVHVGHCIHLNDADRAAWAATGGALLPSTTVTGTADEVKARIDDLGEQGRHRGRVPAVRTRHPPRAGDDVRRRQRLNAGWGSTTPAEGSVGKHGDGVDGDEEPSRELHVRRC